MKKIYSLQVSATNTATLKVAVKPGNPLQPLAKIGLSLLGLMIYSFPTISASAFTAIPPVRRADEFIDSIGVRTEVRSANIQSGPYANNPYRTNFPGVIARLSELRVRHIREGANCSLSDWPSHLSRLTELSNAGIKASLVFSNYSIPPGFPSSTLSEITAGYQNCLNQVRNVVTQVEGLNEPDGRPDATIFGRTFPENALISQQALWNAVKNSPAPINQTPVLGPSLIGPYFRTANVTPNAYRLRGIGQFADFNNLHTYFGSNFPEIASPNCNPYDTSTCGGRDFATLDNYLHLANLTASTETNSIDLPAISTEAGWRGATGDTHNEFVISHYIPRVLLNNFNRGVRRTYIHELADATADRADTISNWGLLRSDSTPKPAYNVLRNMTSFLFDTGTTARTFNPGSFTYTIQPAPNPSPVEPNQTDHFIRNFPFIKTTFLQKSNRKYYIIFWNARASNTQGGYPDPHVWFRINFSRTVTFRQYDPVYNVIQQQGTLNSIGAYAEHYPQIIEIDNPGGTGILTF